MTAITSPRAPWASVAAIEAAYLSGRITYGGLGIRRTPIIDYRGYVDQPENSNETHSRFIHFRCGSGCWKRTANFNNQVMLVEDGSTTTEWSLQRYQSRSEPALTQMDQWLAKYLADRTPDPIPVEDQSFKAKRPVDACFTNKGTVEDCRLQVYSSTRPATNSIRRFRHRRMGFGAGEPLATNVLKCKLRPVDPVPVYIRFGSLRPRPLSSRQSIHWGSVTTRSRA